MMRYLLAASFVLTTALSANAQLIVAHRGASHDAPENTLAAFRMAWQQNADGVEGDFYLTTDGEIVCIHDSDTMRTTGVKRVVESSTLADLRKLQYGRWKDARYDGEPIPTLDEVIETVPDGKTMVIELKSTERIVEPLVQTLRRHQSRPIRWMVITFDGPTAAAFKKRMPDVKTHWLTSFKEAGSTKFRPTATEIAETVRRLGLDGVGMKGMTDVIDARFVNELGQNGCHEFHVWTIDSVTDAHYFANLGAFGITTNIPAIIGDAIR